MEFEKFLTWLQQEKQMNARSARDVVSRLKRAMIIINSKKVDGDSLQQLNSKSEFLDLSMSVKSQLRRSIALYSEYQK